MSGDEQLTITIDEAARLLGLSRGATYRQAKDGALPVVRMGRRLLVLRKPFDELIGARSSGQTAIIAELESEIRALRAEVKALTRTFLNVAKFIIDNLDFPKNP